MHCNVGSKLKIIYKSRRQPGIKYQLNPKFLNILNLMKTNLIGKLLMFALTSMLFFVGYCCYGQSVTIVNVVTGQPVPFATVILNQDLKVTSGAYSNEDGQLTILGHYDFLEISCIGYESKKVFIDEVKEVIFLKEKTYQLDEVIINSNVNQKDLLVGYSKEKKTMFYGVSKGIITAVYIKNSHQVAARIKSFVFNILKCKHRFACRLHFYELDLLTGIPGKELLTDDFVFFVEKGEKGAKEINLSKLNLVFPNGGVCVGVEGLGACDAEGNLLPIAASLLFESFISQEMIYFERPVLFNNKGWDNVNKRVLHDYTEVLKTEASSDAYRVPSFGLTISSE